ncbi:uncharacterized protein LOC135707779 [Ochlerotatus camptorhynchus]|uniref:uncharacterized protein LOC135707779 n=1 Tax=Ochlerotatus camptorhynchus TaxID=644619 RepID=UPI0031E1C0E6
MKTAFYSPMVNDAERVNRVLITCVRALLDENHAGWDENLAAITAAINSAKHDVTGVSPHFANFGRDFLLHTDLYAQEDLNTPEDSKVAQDMRLSTLKRIQNFVLQRIKKNHEKSKQRYNLRTRQVDFKIGDIVWRRTFTQSSKADQVYKKLEPKYVPATVKHILGKNIYALEDVADGKQGRYHAKDIKAD